MSSRSARWATMAIAAMLSTASTRAAHAQAQTQTQTQTPANLAQARQHFETGVALFERQDFEGALAEFLLSYRESQRPSVLFNLGATYEALHRYPDAVDALNRYLASPGVNPRQRAEAEHTLQQIRGLIAHLRLRISPPDSQVEIDGRPASNGLDDVSVGPGTHVVTASRAGFTTGRLEVVIASGESRDVAMDLAPEVALTTPSGSPLAPARSPRATLALHDAPPGATLRIDGRVTHAGQRVDLAPGTYPFEVGAPEARPWSSEVRLAEHEDRTIDVLLAPDHPPVSPAIVWAVALASGVLATASAVTGVLAIDARAEFATHRRSDPGVDEIAARGRALAITADLTGLAAIAGTAIGGYLVARIAASPRRSAGRISWAPYGVGLRAVLAF